MGSRSQSARRANTAEVTGRMMLRAAQDIGSGGCALRARDRWKAANKKMRVATKRPVGARQDAGLRQARDLIMQCALWEHLSRFDASNVTEGELDAVNARLRGQYDRDPGDFAQMLERRLNHLPDLGGHP